MKLNPTILRHTKLMELASAKLGKPLLYLAISVGGNDPDKNYDNDLKEVGAAAGNILNKEQLFELTINGQLTLAFDTIEEMEYTYQHIVGDDGPTKYNDYQGSYRIYALTIINGQLSNENT